MQTTINEVSPVERELEIHATADELDAQVKQAPRAQRGKMNGKGFRQGKAPLPLVKKMYGQALSLQIAESFVQDAYEREIAGDGDLDVLGRPEMTDLDYALDSDLRAVIRFSVRPSIELRDLSDEEIPRLVHDVTGEEVEEEVEKLRRRQADLIPKEDASAEAEDFVLFDLQELDAESRQPLVGKRDEDQSLFLDSPQIEQSPMLQELKQALLGAKAGDAVHFSFSHDAAHGEHQHASTEGAPHDHHFEVRLKDVKRRELPALDAEFVREVTDGEYEDVEAFRAEIRDSLEEAWKQRSEELLQGSIVERMLALHPVPVPEQVVNTYLDSFVEDVKRRNEGELPEDFDESHFRAVNRDEAQQQAHWMLVRDRVAQAYDLEVSDEDLDAFFEEQAAGDDVSAEQLRRFYRSMPDLMGQLRQQVLSRQVFDALTDRFQIIDKDREAYEATVSGEAEPAGAETSPLIEG